MSTPLRSSTALAGAVLIGGLSVASPALAMNELAQGYALGAQAAPPADRAHADADPAREADHAGQGTGTAAAQRADTALDRRAAPKAALKTKAKTDASAAGAPREPAKKMDAKDMAEGKCGEGKCGGGG
ncbi:hypothetical protein JR065_01315 [Xanthomonas sp. AmX2]|uniref:HvfA family oxazolone/thioamide-modified RiPP metallophore n=1 Tax=Xanthomonas sp. TaxID=29446 RepID=UPI00198215ED|nr:hypothetical protein [Xanthomonas sp.]MBN6148966.1 hypothetical protein [Xanthomonas sp.]